MYKDNFSKQAELYAKYRPHYPEELYDFIYQHTDHFDIAWDCGTGNGQVANILSKKFDAVYATDISQKQISHAVKAGNIYYAIGSAESSGLHIKVDLITVAQAIHWFDLEKFYNEALRLAKSNATLAYWGYGLLNINDKIDPFIEDFYKNVIGPYWDPERALVDRGYEDIQLPLKKIRKKMFTHSTQWNLEQLTGYLRSWSAVQKFMKTNGIDPVEQLNKNLEPIYKSDTIVNFPIFLTVGYI